jgi:hypothetical protein
MTLSQARIGSWKVREVSTRRRLGVFRQLGDGTGLWMRTTRQMPLLPIVQTQLPLPIARHPPPLVSLLAGHDLLAHARGCHTPLLSLSLLALCTDGVEIINGNQ